MLQSSACAHLAPRAHPLDAPARADPRSYSLSPAFSHILPSNRPLQPCKGRASTRIFIILLLRRKRNKEKKKRQRKKRPAAPADTFCFLFFFPRAYQRIPPLLFTPSRNAARGGAVRTASKCDKARYNTVVNGIAIVDAFYAEDINGCLRQRPCRQTLDDTLLLVNGEKPTFVSYACRHQRNTRQQAEHNRRMRLKAIGVPVPVHKCADRLRLEREGAILVMDGYVSRREDCRVTSISQAYRAHFPSRPPSPDRTAPPSKRLSRVTKYLVDEAVLGHRPIFERVPSSEVYGEGYEYMTSTQALADAEVTAVLDACSRVTKVCEPCVMSDGDDVPTAEIPSGPSVDSTYDLEYGALWSPATIRRKMDVADDEAGQLHARDLCRVSA